MEKDSITVLADFSHSRGALDLSWLVPHVHTETSISNEDNKILGVSREKSSDVTLRLLVSLLVQHIPLDEVMVTSCWRLTAGHWYHSLELWLAICEGEKLDNIVSS